MWNLKDSFLSDCSFSANGPQRSSKVSCMLSYYILIDWRANLWDIRLTFRWTTLDTPTPCRYSQKLALYWSIKKRAIRRLLRIEQRDDFLRISSWKNVFSKGSSLLNLYDKLSKGLILKNFVFVLLLFQHQRLVNISWKSARYSNDHMNLL